MGTLVSPFVPNAAQIGVALLGAPSMQTTNGLRWGSKGSLSLTVAGPHAGKFHDFETGDKGDLIDLVKLTMGGNTAAALTWLGQLTGVQNNAPIIPRPVPAPKAHAWSPKDEANWRCTQPLCGTLGEEYLRSRGCYVPGAGDLRFKPGEKGYPPAIFARVTDFQTGHPQALVRIPLDKATGRKLGPAVPLAGHSVRGGVVRLIAPVAVDGRIGVAEGIETALSLIAGDRGPVWATLGAGNLADLPVYDAFNEIVIWADNDEPGLRAADTLAERWHDAGKIARIIPPDDPFNDWNDVVRAAPRGQGR